MRLPTELHATRRDGTPMGLAAAACSLAARCLLALLAAAAFGFSAYLAWLSLTGGAVPGCESGGVFDCDHVLSSRWSTWFGVPVALPAAMTYGSILSAVWFLGPNVPGAVRRVAWAIMLALSAMAGLAAIWFVGLQFLAIGSFCWPCLATHTSGLLLAAVAWTIAWLNARDAATSFVRSGLFAGGAAAAAGAALAAGQLAYEPPTFRIERDESPEVAATDAGASPAVSASGRPPADHSSQAAAIGSSVGEPSPHATHKPALSRVLHLNKTTLTVDAYEHPILGSPDAEHVVVKLFDYTCPYCRDLHFKLEDVRRELDGRLAVVVLPVPMDKRCNAHAVDWGEGRHAQACAYARYAVTVWQTDRAKFAEFHHWLFEPDNPPPVDEVRERVRRLVGEAGIDRADNSREPRQAIELYSNIYGAYENKRIPKIVDERFVVIGQFRDARQLVEVLEEEWRKTR